MKYTKGKYRILLHLEGKEIKNLKKAPYSICQNGIAENVSLSRSRTSKILRNMIKEGLIKEKTGRVVGVKRRRKVYSLTRKGRRKAKEIRKDLEDQTVTIKTDSGNEEVKMEEIGSYIDSQYPMLVALNKLDDDGVINLSEEDREQKDVFANREQEIKALTDKLDRVKSGETSIVLIKGKPGIGKTRLVNEFKEKAISEGFEFLAGKGHYSSSEPYLPFSEALKYEMKNDETEFGLSFQAIRPVEEPITMKNSKDTQFIDQSLSTPFSGNLRKKVFDRAIELIKKLSQENPLILFLDDLQWADKSSLILFHYLAKNLKEEAVFIIGAYRDTALERDHFLNEVLLRMSRNELFEEIEVKPLEWEDTKEIGQGLLGSKDIPEEFFRLVHKISEGNPLISRELIKQMMEDDTLDVRKNELPMDYSEIHIPEVVEDIIHHRINNLSKETLRVVQISSIIGENIDFELLQKVSQMDSVDLLEHVDVLEESQLWETEPGEEVFNFSHGLVHRAIYENVPIAVKKDIHKKTAHAMKELYDGKLEDYYSDIAFHFKKGDESKKALEFYHKAGDRYKELWAHEDAIEMYDEALECADNINQKEKRWTILEKKGDVYLTLGAFDKGLVNYEKIPKNLLEVEDRQRIYRKIAKVHCKKGRLNECLKYVEKGLKESEKNNLETSRLFFRKGWGELKSGEYDAAKKDFSEALKLNEKYGGEKKEVSAIYHGLGTACYHYGDYEKAITNLKKGIEISKEIEDVYSKASHQCSLGNMYLEFGDIDIALEKFKKCLEIFEEIGDKSRISSIITNLGNCHLKRGELERAYERYKESYEMFEDMENQRGLSISLNNLGYYYFRRGELDSALKHYEKSLGISKKHNIEFGRALGHNNIGTIYKLKGDYDTSEEHYKKSIEIGKTIGKKEIVLDSTSRLAEVLVLKGKTKKGLDKANEAAELCENIDSKVEKGMYHRVLGKIYSQIENESKAEEEFRKSMKILENSDDKKELAELYYDYSLHLDFLDRVEKSEEYLNRAKSLFEKIGMKPWFEKYKK